MNAEQFNAALERLKISKAEAGLALGLSERQMRRYAEGSRSVASPVAKLLKLALTGKITVDEIRKAKS